MGSVRALLNDGPGGCRQDAGEEERNSWEEESFRGSWKWP